MGKLMFAAIFSKERGYKDLKNRVDLNGNYILYSYSYISNWNRLH